MGRALKDGPSDAVILAGAKRVCDQKGPRNNAPPCGECRYQARLAITAAWETICSELGVE